MGILRRSVVYSRFLLISLQLLLLSLSSPIFSYPVPDPSAPDIHDMLPHYNIPKGIVPDAVKSYTFSSEDGAFTVQMERTCYVKFADDQLVYYDKVIRGKLSYGKISQVSGIQAKKLFIWLPVTGLNVDSDSSMVEFHVGAFSQKFPAEEFQIIPTCIKKSNPNAFSLKFKPFWANHYLYE